MNGVNKKVTRLELTDQTLQKKIIGEPEDTAMETIQKETQKEK